MYGKYNKVKILDCTKRYVRSYKISLCRDCRKVIALGGHQGCEGTLAVQTV